MDSEEPASAMAAMRAATRQVHEELERRLAVASPSASREDYIDHVAALLGWLQAWEQQLWAGEWPAEMQARERDGKCEWLIQDLHAAGWSPDAIGALPTSSFRPLLSSLPARFGTAYVIEGAQLGGQVLQKSLAPVLAPWSPRWLQGYGEDSGRKWKLFMQCCDQYVDSAAGRQQAADAAARAFKELASWFTMRRIA